MNPTLDISQYAHTSWKFRDGFTKGGIHNIAQTSDGYLWLATSFGLYKFDGVKTVAWQPPPDQPLPSNDVLHILAARDGTLWIGTRNGLASWKNGKLARYEELAGLNIFALIEDREGLIWVGAYGITDGKLCEVRNGAIRCHPEIGNLGRGVMGLHEDAKGNLWVGLSAGGWRWKPGPPEFYSSQLGPVQYMSASADGGLVAGLRGGVFRPLDGAFQLVYALPKSMRDLRVLKVLRDRDGGLWGGTFDRGIVHWRQGRTDLFSESDGLTGDGLSSLFEDREGNIWAATGNGLDRFRELSVVTYSGKQGLSTIPGPAILPASDGSVWFTTTDSLNRLDHGQLTIYRPRPAPVGGGVREILVNGLPMLSPAALAEDSRGRIWFSSSTAVGYLDHDRFISTPVPGGIVSAINGDSSGNMWIAHQDQGLFRWSEPNELRHFVWEDTFGRRDPARSLAADPVHGGIWLGFIQGGIAYLQDGKVRAWYTAANGLASGTVYSLRFDSQGVLWVAAEGGLSQLKNGHIATLTTLSGLPCRGVHVTLEDDDHSVWMMTPCGLLHVARIELDASLQKPGAKIHPTVFDASDGIMNRALPGGQTPYGAKSKDGKIWFWNIDGVGMVDPLHLPVNKLAPPAQIEQITADRNTYDTASDPNPHLPPLVRDLAIDYTALSFVAPEKIRFKYKLEGHDRDWQDAGNRRQAFYNDLPPRDYRFRVMASNNSGVWNEAGALLNFSIAPKYYQTRWFQVLSLVALLALLAALYQLRLRQVARNFNLRMEERLNERTRIARDLHDTLLQSFQGLLLKFHTVSYYLPDRPAEAQATLNNAIEQARKAIVEGRDAIQGLRGSTVTADLANAIAIMGEELAASPATEHPPAFRVQVEGVPETSTRCSRMKFTGLRQRRCAMHFAMPSRNGSKWKFAMMNGSFGCGFVTTERESMPQF